MEEVFRTGDTDARREVLQSLEAWEAAEAVPLLLRGLEDSSEDIQSAAIHGLGAHRALEAVSRLNTMLTTLPIWSQLHRPLVEALERLGHPSSVETLASVVQDVALGSTRGLAIQALARIGTPEATAILESLWPEADKDIEEELRKVLGGGRRLQSIRASRQRAKMAGNLSGVLSRFEELIRQARPEVAASLRAGANTAELRYLSKALFGGRPVPTELKAWFRWHDGQAQGASLSWDPVSSERLLTIRESVAKCELWRNVDPKRWDDEWVPLVELDEGFFRVAIVGEKGRCGMGHFEYDGLSVNRTHSTLTDWVRELSDAWEERLEKP
jgi:hypothetical protein